jgi:hypothetical protein
MSELPIQQGGLRVLSGIVPASSASTYGTHYSYLGVGGYVEVPNIDYRNSIPPDSNMNDEGYSTGRRRYGMMVYVIDEDKLYRLFPFSGGSVVSMETFTGTSELNQVTMLSNNNGWIEVPDLSVLITGGTYFSGNSSIVLYDSTGGTVSITGITTTDVVNPGDGRVLVSTGNSENIFVAQSNMVFNGTNLNITGGTFITDSGGSLHPSAIAQFKSTTKGVLFPVLTTVEKNAILNPTSGLTVFDSTIDDISVYTSSGWTGVIAERDNLQRVTDRGNSTNTGLRISGTTYIVGSGSSSTSSSLLISNSANTLTSQFTDEGKVYLAIPASGSSQYSVGIGTQSPQAILHVLYNFGQVIRNERISDNNSGPTYRLVKGRGSLTGPTAILVNDGLGDFNWQGYHTSGSTQATSSGTYVGYAARISANAIENWSSTQRGARINFEVNQSGTTTNVTVVNMLHNSVNIGNSTNPLSATLGIKSSGSTSGLTLRIVNSSNTDTLRILDSGNVLINTTTDAGYKLDVNGRGHFTDGLVLEQSGYAGFINNGMYSSMGYNTNPENNNTVLKIGFGAGTSVTTLLKLDNSTNVTQPFGGSTVLLDLIANPSQTNNIIQWRNSSGVVLGVVNNLGHIGIGTTGSTEQRLFVSGSTLFRSTGTTSGSTAFSVQNSTGGTLLNLFSNGNLNIDSGVLYVDGDNGRVGIGTTSPSEKLSISAGNMSMESGRFIKFNYSTPFWIGADGTANGFTIFDATASLRRFSITTAGNVLIGTTTDAGFKLDVNGTVRFQDNLLFSSTKGIYATDTLSTILQSSTNYFTHNRVASSGTLGFQIAVVGNAQSFWRWNDATGDVEFGNVAGYGLQLYTNNLSRVIILSNGNVLIGTTTNAGYKLDVSGTTRINARFSITDGGSNERFIEVRRASGWLCFGNTAGSESIAMNNGTLLIGVEPDSQTAKVQIQGTGSTSITKPFLIQNSLGTQLGYVDDSGQWQIGTGVNSGYRLELGSFNNGLKITSTNNSAYNAIVVNSDFVINGVGVVQLGRSTASTTFNASTHQFNIGSSSNRITTTTGGGFEQAFTFAGSYGQSRTFTVGSGLSKQGLWYDTGSALGIYRNTFPDTSSPVLIASTTGNVLIGTTTDANYILDVSGTTRVVSTGSTSGSTTLTLQNSTGRTTTEFRSDGVIGISSASTFTTQVTSVISASTTNSGIAIVPNGTGAFTLNIPDGTAVGGTARGTNAVDLQMSRTSASSVAAWNYDSILGGRSNYMSANADGYRVIGGGFNNQISVAGYSFIGGGSTNIISGGGSAYNSILGGLSNTASSSYSTVIGGQSNTSSGQYSISGGRSNTASGSDSTSFGRNCVASNTGAVAIGYYARAIGYCSVALGGEFGVGNQTLAAATYGLATGGQSLSYLQSHFTNAGGMFTSQGDAQQSLLTSRAISAVTSGGTVTLSLDGTGTANLIIPNGNNRAWNVVVNTITVCTVVSGGTLTVGDAHAGEYKFLFKRVGGTSTISPITTSSEVADTSMATASYSFSAGTSQQMAITFNAPNTANNSTFRAVAKVALTEVAW